MKRILGGIILLILVGCNSGGSGSSSPTAPSIENINIIQSTGTFDVNESGLYDLNITGHDNIITIIQDNDIDDFKLIGSRNALTFEANISVKDFQIIGDDNIINLPTDLDIPYSIIGSGTVVNRY